MHRVGSKLPRDLCLEFPASSHPSGQGRSSRNPKSGIQFNFEPGVL